MMLFPLGPSNARGSGHWPPAPIGLALWGLFAVVIGVLAVVKPGRPITHIYRDAALDWWSGVPVYTGGIHGFLYFPSSAVLYGPFAALPLGLCDQIWRLLLVAVFSAAIARTAALLRRDAAHWTAAWVLALAIPTASINLLRGQWELMMVSIILHAAIDIARGDERRGGWLLALAVALKPLALVPALLFGAVRPGVRGTLLFGLVAAAAVPFLHPDPAYVAGQYVAMVAKLTTAAAPDSGSWFDLTTLLASAGVRPSYPAMTHLRIAAALATLAVAFTATQRLDRPTATLVTVMLAVFYLVLFNPRTEEGSYLNVAALAALAAFAEHRRQPTGALWVVLGAVVFGLGMHFYGDWIYRPTRPWLKQALTLGLYPYVAWIVVTGRSLATPEPEPEPAGAWRADRVALAVCLGVVPLWALDRFAIGVPVRAWLADFDADDFAALAAAVLLAAFVLPAASGPVRAWMRRRRRR
ncbi:glycosyltransferase family 87 protein [Azospirillum sp. sgz301742]